MNKDVNILSHQNTANEILPYSSQNDYYQGSNKKQMLVRSTMGKSYIVSKNAN